MTADVKEIGRFCDLQISLSCGRFPKYKLKKLSQKGAASLLKSVCKLRFHFAWADIVQKKQSAVKGQKGCLEPFWLCYRQLRAIRLPLLPRLSPLRALISRVTDFYAFVYVQPVLFQ